MTSEESILCSYPFEEGPPYPAGRRRGEEVGDFIRRLQREELYAVTKNIFAPVNLHYDAHKANLARFNRERAVRLRQPLSSGYLTD